MYPGNSFQTWEYSPEFALRSYLYVLIHAGIGKFWQIFVLNKITVFYLIRITLGVFCALCETLFIRGASEQFGRRIAFLTFAFLLFSSGMFNAGASYLPSTFTMYFLMLAQGYWMSASKSKRYNQFALSIAMTGIAGLIGWPFCIVAVLPLGFDILIQFGILSFLKVGIIVAGILIGSNIAIDYAFYQKLMFTPFNLLMYNRGSGSQLYGVEPWDFYFKNLFLNFNVVSGLALACPIVMLLHYLVRGKEPGSAPVIRRISFVLPFHIWFSFMTAMPHKEERFLFLVYPTLCLAGAVALDHVLDILFAKMQSIKNIITAVAVFGFVILSVSRSFAIVDYYGAPLKVYQQLHDELRRSNAGPTTNVCVGKEWYRYPSSFFIPSGHGRLQFVRSEFRGLLPKPFDNSKGVMYATSTIPTGLNNQNREEMSIYVTPDKCDYMVDFDFEGQKEERYALSNQWEPAIKAKFLDASKSPALTRAFYIPKLSQERNVFGTYYVLKRKTA
jgi:alpha-1,2-mannosyltransferase